MRIIEGHNELNVQLVPVSAGLANLYGFVHDLATGAPVQGVAVNCHTVVDAITDAAGYYEIQGLFPGVYTLTAGKNGYEPFSQVITLQEGNNEVDITLTPIEEPPPPPPGAEIPLGYNTFVIGINGLAIVELSPGVYSLAQPISMSTLQGVSVQIRYDGDPRLEQFPSDWAGWAGYLSYRRSSDQVLGPGFQGTASKAPPGSVAAIPVFGPWVLNSYTPGLYDALFQIFLYPYGQRVGDFVIRNMAQASSGG
ncbi:MAG: carboxypeptidase-like regulatory domain-containing protein [Dehalococcoidales bacterium]|nr:carboxypeptidase-like regulatory domain-containing protein [Dehalococcoidales bacterium]